MDDKSLLVGILIGSVFSLSAFGRLIYWRGIDRGIEICKEAEEEILKRKRDRK